MQRNSRIIRENEDSDEEDEEETTRKKSIRKGKVKNAKHINQNNLKEARDIAKTTKQIQLTISEKLRQVVGAVILVLAVTHYNTVKDKDLELNDLYFSVMVIVLLTYLEIKMKIFRMMHKGILSSVWDFLLLLVFTINSYFVFPAVRILSNRIISGSPDDNITGVILLRLMGPIVLICFVIVVIEKIGYENIIQLLKEENDSSDSPEGDVENQLMKDLSIIPIYDTTDQNLSTFSSSDYDSSDSNNNEYDIHMSDSSQSTNDGDNTTAYNVFNTSAANSFYNPYVMT